MLYRSMFGGETVRPVAGGFSLAIGLSRFDISNARGGGFAEKASARRHRMRPAALPIRWRSACACVGWTIPTECSKAAVSACDATGYAW